MRPAASTAWLTTSRGGYDNMMENGGFAGAGAIVNLSHGAA